MTNNRHVRRYKVDLGKPGLLVSHFQLSKDKFFSEPLVP